MQADKKQKKKSSLSLNSHQPGGSEAEELMLRAAAAREGWSPNRDQSGMPFLCYAVKLLSAGTSCSPESAVN